MGCLMSENISENRSVERNVKQAVRCSSDEKVELATSWPARPGQMADKSDDRRRQDRHKDDTGKDATGALR